MRRADRLFQIIQRLRRRGVTTAARLAEALEVSERTIYRDIQDLMASGVPVQGEAGVGYTLPKGFDLPPLMFTEAEIEAVVLGIRIVQSWGDPALGRAADDALTKIENVLPGHLKNRIAEAVLFSPGVRMRGQTAASLATLRSAIREQRRIEFAYEDQHKAGTTRTARPLGLFYWGQTWSLGAWCELRSAFRNFRVDRITSLIVTDAFPTETGRTLRDLIRYFDPDGD